MEREWPQTLAEPSHKFIFEMPSQIRAGASCDHFVLELYYETAMMAMMRYFITAG